MTDRSAVQRASMVRILAGASRGDRLTVRAGPDFDISMNVTSGSVRNHKNGTIGYVRGTGEDDIGHIVEYMRYEMPNESIRAITVKPASQRVSVAAVTKVTLEEL